MVYIIDPQNAGISGNMIIGALVDLGADGEKVKCLMEDVAVDFGEVEVSLNKVNKSGIDATFCNVKTIDEDNENNHHVHFPDFMEKIDLLKYADIENLTDEMVEMAKKVFKRIAISESRVHGKSLEEVHFHEVGAADAVADVLGSICAYFDLGMNNDKVVGLPIAVGGGVVKTAHGRIPVPAPASLDILKGLNEDSFKDFSKGEAKCIGGPVNSELATPTGSAIYAEICDEISEFIPPVKPKKIAYGAGKKDFDHPNILRIIETSDISEKDTIDVIETNLDHLTGEEIGYLFDNLLDNGASDVSITPIIMKKNRQGSLLKVISKRKNRNQLVNVIFKETGSLGIRIAPNLHRGIAKREFVKKEFEINGEIFEVTFKNGYVNGEIISSRAEYEDLKKIAQKTGLPLIKVKEMIR